MPGKAGDLWQCAVHDFRTLGQSLLGLAPAIAGADTVADRRELAGLIHGCATSLTGMIDLMSLMARLEAGQSVPCLERVSLEAVTGGVASELGAAASERGCRIVCRGPAAFAASDGLLFRHAVYGMALTALKLRVNGDIEIASSGDASGGFVRVDVTYSGIDPAAGLSRSAFVEIAAAGTDPGAPFIGLGSTLAGRLAPRLGGGFEVGPAEAGRWKLSLQLPAATES